MDLTSYSKIRRIVIILLLGLIALLLFSLYALYDHYYTYEMSSEPIEYENEPYVEFFITTGNTIDTVEYVPDQPVNVTLGVANFLNEKQNFTLIYQLKENENSSITLENIFVLNHGSSSRKEITVDIDFNGTATLNFTIYDKKMTPLQEREVLFIPQ